MRKREYPDTRDCCQLSFQSLAVHSTRLALQLVDYLAYAALCMPSIDSQIRGAVAWFEELQKTENPPAGVPAGGLFCSWWRWRELNSRQNTLSAALLQV